ncbi:MAG TPA: PBP1A family penicillin-binding protein [Longimicrobiales bacterium]|nr:PBP1A family penicillin-binding protein [Longimicrobiales bacterium]
MQNGNSGAEPAGQPRNTPQFTERRRREAFVLVGILAVAIMLGLLWQRCGLGGCPNVGRLTAYQPGGASVLLDVRGDTFASLAPVEHEVVALETLPDYVPAAFLAVEDQRFYSHNGIDFRRVGGALIADIRARGFVQGFSTITMQLARNVWPERLPGRRRTLTRKVLEIRVAHDIERNYSKDEILELYLNHIYFGGGSYGIDAASRNYFGKPASDLSLHEAAVLAAMPKSPTAYNPRRFAERARERRNLVLRLMADQGRITEEEAGRAAGRRVAVRREPPSRRADPGTAPYFVEAVRRVLEDRFGEDVYTSTLRVHTTLDPRAQRIAEQYLEQQLRAIERGAFGSYAGTRYTASTSLDGAPDYVQGAFVLLDARNGDVRALVGGRDFLHSRFDRATQARRQPGSAFKPFVFAAAIADGYAPSQLVSDSVLRMELAGGEVWEPRNIDGEYEGAVTIREALVRSKNVPTIRLAADVGLSQIIRLAQRAGIRSDIPALPSIAIGTAGTTPLELTGAYTMFARLGSAVPPRFVSRVETLDGRRVWEPSVRSRPVTDSATAFLVTDMLREAVDRGTGAAIRNSGYRGPAAGKTGTTNEGADAWFVGYTPAYVGTVWIGLDRPVRITGQAGGGRLAAPVWARVLRDYERVAGGGGDWTVPSRVVEREVDPSTGLVLRDGCRPERGRARDELFVAGSEPAAVCPAGTPTEVERGMLGRIGSWFGGRWRQFTRWATRHFGTEEPQPTPRDGDYLGVPRLPRAVETDEEVDPRAFEPVPIGTPVDPETLEPLDTVPAERDTVVPPVAPAPVPPPDTVGTGG